MSVYTPEFIPYYVAEVRQYGLTTAEGLIYGFIRFYTKNGSPFYFSNSHIAEMLGFSESKVSRAIIRMGKIGLFEIVYGGKQGRGEIRYINVARQKAYRTTYDRQKAYTRSAKSLSFPGENTVQNKRESKRALSLTDLDSNELANEFGVKPKAIEKVATKYFLHCEDKSKRPTLAGFKLWLTSEKWDESDYSIKKQNELARQALMEGFME